MSPSADELRSARVVWDYMFLRHELGSADIIIGLGCHDLSVADDVATLYSRGIAPVVVFAGDAGRLTSGLFDRSEAQMLKERAVGLGVPEEVILLEEASTNTGENIAFSQTLIENHGLTADRIVLVHKQYMLRRDYATFMKQWKGAERATVICWAQDSTLDSFLASTIFDPVETINIMVGDLQRIMLFPDLGYEITQKVPDEVLQAYEELTAKGYTRHLTNEATLSV